VEFAILAPLFFMITFGAITAAITFYNQNQITTAAREGARYGATLRTTDTVTPAGCAGAQGFLWACSVLNVTVNAAFGDLGPTVTGRYVCVSLVTGSGAGTIYNPGGAPGNYGAQVTGNGAVTLRSTPCYNDGGADGNQRVQVVTQKQGQINAVLFQVTPNITAHASAKHEEEGT